MKGLIKFGLMSLLLFVVGCDGCNPAGIGIGKPAEPEFVVTKTTTDHGIITATWYITIKNKGGSGSRLVQYWVGKSDDKSSRTIIYSERHTLNAGQETTIKVLWEHGGVGAIGAAVIYGGSDGIEFRP